MLLGYRRLQQRGEPELVQECKHELSQTSSPIKHETASAAIFFSAKNQSDLVIRQYLTKKSFGRFIGLSLYNALGGGVPIHHLPPHTYAVLRDNGIPIWETASKLLWSLSLMGYWLYGCGQMLLLGLWNSNREQESQPGTSAFFLDLLPNATPDTETKFERQDLINWYARWEGRNPKIRTVAHQHRERTPRKVGGMDVEYRPAIWSGSITGSARWNFALWCLQAASMGLFDLLRGRWWHAMLLPEAVMAKKLALSPEGSLPTEIWLNHENYNFKPLWVYEAEARGVGTFLYFYSVNNQTVQPAGAAVSIAGHWELMNWKRILVWTEQHEKLLRSRAAGSAKFIRVGHMPFLDSNTEIEPIVSPSIAIFDVPGFKAGRILALGQAYKYTNDKMLEGFYRDIMELSAARGVSVHLKRKSRPDGLLTPRYRALIKGVLRSDTAKSVDPGVAPHRLIMATDATISVPYSTTSVIAKALGKPTCYYDSLGILPETSEFSHGIEIIRSRGALEKWIKRNLTP